MLNILITKCNFHIHNWTANWYFIVAELLSCINIIHVKCAIQQFVRRDKSCIFSRLWKWLRLSLSLYIYILNAHTHKHARCVFLQSTKCTMHMFNGIVLILSGESLINWIWIRLWWTPRACNHSFSLFTRTLCVPLLHLKSFTIQLCCRCVMLIAHSKIYVYIFELNGISSWTNCSIL